MQSKRWFCLFTFLCFTVCGLTESAELWPHRPTDPVNKADVPFAQRVDPEIDRQMRSLEWRCVGPFVGNRGCGVEMHPTDRNVFYHAHSSGGVWKTEDAGQYWVPITDGQINVGSVGAIAVSQSEPDVIYIGTASPNCVIAFLGATACTSQSMAVTPGNMSAWQRHGISRGFVFIPRIRIWSTFLQLATRLDPVRIAASIAARMAGKPGSRFSSSMSRPA